MLSTLIKEKPAWALASLLSIIYAIAFVLVVNNIVSNNLLFGFCVWGVNNGEDPNDAGLYPGNEGCRPNFPINSHLAAFVIDVIMTGLAAVFYVLDRNKDKKKVVYIAMGFIILSHGMLHLFMDIIVNCYTTVTPGLERVGYFFVGIFCFALSAIILSQGFPGKWTRNMVISVIVALLVVLISKVSGKGDQQSQYSLPAIFVVSHPLSCITGLFTTNVVFSPTVAKLFVVCTTVGILELLSCKDILRPIGGHAWYDLTLHAAVLAALPYFHDTREKKA